MYSAILDYLCCPKCRKNFAMQADTTIDGDVIEGQLTCENGHVFRICEGVVDFNSVEQDFANQWEALDDLAIDERNPTEILERRKLVLNAIANAVCHNGMVLLDIASGRGLMLAELVKAFDGHLISIDLSPFILNADHKKFRQIAPNAKISFLACDATNLPIKDCVIDAASTYCGFSNMIGCAEKALQEVHRVLKKGGALADSFVVIEKDSKGYELLSQVCAEQNLTGAEEFFLHEGVANQHNKLFNSVEYNEVFSGIGVGNGMDLLPYHGEWYAEQVFISKK